LWGIFVVVLCTFVLFWLFQSFSPLMRQPQNYFWDTISRIGGWGMNTKIIKTEALLHLNLEIFLNFFNFLYIYFFHLFIFNFQSSLCLSNACSAYGWLVHYLSLFISLKNFFVCFFVLYFSTCLFVFPFSYNFFAFYLLLPFNSKYH
jgi:hypothetical protein